MDSATHQMMKIMMMNSMKRNMMTMRTRITITRRKTTITMRMRMIMMMRMMRMMTTPRAEDLQTDAAIAMEGSPRPARGQEKEAVRAVRDGAQVVHAADPAVRTVDPAAQTVDQIARTGEDREIQEEVAQAVQVEVLRAQGGDQGTPHPVRILPLTILVQAQNADLHR